LDEVAWVMNLRGLDVPNCPLITSYAIVERSGKARLFIDPWKVDDPHVSDHLTGSNVQVMTIIPTNNGGSTALYAV